MKIQRIDHIGINVNDLAAATAFFVDLGLNVEGEGEVGGEWVDKVVGLRDVNSSIVFLGTPNSQTKIELVKFHSPADQNEIHHLPANTLGYRHIALAVDDIDAIVAKLKTRGAELFSEIQTYENIYKLCYVRGPEGIILELAERIQ